MLVDFGLARLMEGPTTTTGAKAMTPGYSPPEQYGASRTNSRTDIYALAATMYTLLTGAMPEDGLERALGQRTLTSDPHPEPENFHRRSQSAIERALEVLPENRFQIIGDFQKALASAVPAAPQAATVSAPPKTPGSDGCPGCPAAEGGSTESHEAGRSAAPATQKGFPWGCALSAMFVLILLIAGGLLFGKKSGRCFDRLRGGLRRSSPLPKPKPR